LSYTRLISLRYSSYFLLYVKLFYSFCFDSNDKFIYDDETKHENIEFLRVCNRNYPF